MRDQAVRFSTLLKKATSVFEREGASGVLKRIQRKIFPPNGQLPEGPVRWIERYTPTVEELGEMRIRSKEFRYRPLISILLPVYNTDPYVLSAALESVRSQAYPFWELCIADDASPRPQVRELLEKFRGTDPRIKICFREKNGHIAHATNSALELATGDFVALLDHDDALSPHALFRVAEALNASPDTDILYSNEDKIEGAGPGEYRTEPAFKGGWSPIYFLSFMYIGHLGVYRASLVREVGGFRPGYEGSQDYDLALRVSERARAVIHIPDILYHWRKIPGSVAGDLHAKPYAFESAKRALRDALARRGLEGTVEDTSLKGIYRTRITQPKGTRVSVFVLGGEGPDTALRSVTTGFPFDLVRGVLADLPSVASSESEVKLCGPDSGKPYDFWKRALEYSSGTFIALCDHEVWPLVDDWLPAFMDVAAAGNGGVVTGKVLSREGRVLHAGYSLHGDTLSADFFGAGADDFGYCARLVTPHDVGVASTRFALVRREVLEEALRREFSEDDMRESFEVVLAQVAREKGFRVLFTPHASCVYNGTELRVKCSLRGASTVQGQIPDPFYPPGLKTNPANFQMAD